MLKTSAHFQTGGTGLSRWLQAGVTSVTYAGSYPRNEPVDERTIVGRVMDQRTFRVFSDTPERAAAIYFTDELWPIISANSFIWQWEVLNEPDWKDDDNPANSPRVMAWVCEFIWWTAKMLRDRNITPVIGNWSVGQPDYPVWQHAEWLLRATREFGAKMGRHCYGPLDTHYAYRYENDAEVFTAMGYPDVKFYLTECGLDNVQQFRPWKDYYGNSPEGFGRYWSEWIEPFERHIRLDARVLGAHLFTLGTGGASAWEPYDVSKTAIAERMVSLSRELGEIPAPIEPPTPGPIGDEMKFLRIENIRHLLEDLGIVLPEYEVVALRDLTVRNQDGATVGMVLKSGEGAYIYSNRQTIGGWDDRLVITPPDSLPALNVWAGPASSPTLRRV